MLELDIRTLHVIIAIVAFSGVLTMFALWQTQQQRRGSGFWVLGKACAFFGCLLIAGQGSFPDMVSVVLANMLFALTFLLILKGIREFTRLPQYKLLDWGLPALLLVYFSYFTYIEPDLNARVVGISLVYISLSISIIYSLLGHGRKTWWRAAIAVSIVYGLFAATSLVRTLLVFFEDNVQTLMQMSEMQSYMILAGIFVIGGSAITLVLLAYTALEVDLKVLAQAVSQSNSSVIITDTDGAIEYVNEGFMNHTGYKRQEVMGQNPRILKSGETAPAVYKEMWEALKSGNSWRGELHNRKKNGDLYWEIASIAPVKQGDGNFSHYVAVKENITDLKKAEAHIRHMATHDALTGLPTKTLCKDRFSIAIGSARRNKKEVALIFIDLDGFKGVNDTLGHNAGDRVLKETAKRLESRLRTSDTVSRVGGDEFLVLLTEVSSRQAVSNVANELIQAVAKPFYIDSEVVKIGASMGIALYPEHGDDFSSLTQAADQAMYTIKHSGKNNYGFSE